MHGSHQSPPYSPSTGAIGVADGPDGGKPGLGGTVSIQDRRASSRMLTASLHWLCEGLDTGSISWVFAEALIAAYLLVMSM